MNGYADLEKKDVSQVEKAIGKPLGKRKANDVEKTADEENLDPEAKRIKNEQLEKEKQLKVLNLTSLAQHIIQFLSRYFF
jgi:hypothetical protein